MSSRYVPISVPVFLAVIAACGGSSSETPFPIEPDWRREAKSSGPSRELVFSGSDTDAGAGDIEGDIQETEAGEATPTWGGTDELEDLESEPPPRPRPKQPPPEAEEDLELELQ